MEQRNDRGHYHTVMVLTHLNSLAKDEKDGFTADAMGLRNLYSTFLHKRSRCVILPDPCSAADSIIMPGECVREE